MYDDLGATSRGGLTLHGRVSTSARALARLKSPVSCQKAIVCQKLVSVRGGARRKKNLNLTDWAG